MVKGVSSGKEKLLIDEYEQLIAWFEKLDEDDPYRLEMRGAELVTDVPITNYITRMEQKFGIHEFHNLPIQEQARHIAVVQLENMQQFIERHAYRQKRAKNENANQTPLRKGAPKAAARRNTNYRRAGSRRFR